MKKQFYTYDEIHQICQTIADRIRMLPVEQQPTSIVGIKRGGGIPAMILGYILNLPVTTISYSSSVGKGDNKNHRNDIPYEVLHTKRQIIVDDIIDSGHTMAEISQAISNVGNAALTAAVIYKEREIPQHIPYVYGQLLKDVDTWIVFPWESK